MNSNTKQSAKITEQVYKKRAAVNLAKAAAARANGDTEYAEFMEECAADNLKEAEYFHQESIRRPN